MFINWDFMQNNRLETTPLPRPIPVHNVDGTLNEHGSITEEIEVILCHREHSERACLAVANLGQQTMIIGYPWLSQHNPKIDWSRQKIEMTQCPLACGIRVKETSDSFEIEPGDKIFAIFLELQEVNLADICSISHLSNKPAQAQVPEVYQDYEDIFSKDKFNMLPPHKSWDHVIELIPRADLPHA